MKSRLALHPDLNECELEDRTLMAAPGQFSVAPFSPINPFTNQFIVAGANPGGQGGGAVSPGPQFYYLLIGANANGGGSFSPGSAVSVYGVSRGATLGGGSVAIGSGANEQGGGGGGGTLSNFAAT